MYSIEAPNRENALTHTVFLCIFHSMLVFFSFSLSLVLSFSYFIHFRFHHLWFSLVCSLHGIAQASYEEQQWWKKVIKRYHHDRIDRIERTKRKISNMKEKKNEKNYNNCKWNLSNENGAKKNQFWKKNAALSKNLKKKNRRQRQRWWRRRQMRGMNMKRT